MVLAHVLEGPPAGLQEVGALHTVDDHLGHAVARGSAPLHGVRAVAVHQRARRDGAYAAGERRLHAQLLGRLPGSRAGRHLVVAGGAPLHHQRDPVAVPERAGRDDRRPRLGVHGELAVAHHDLDGHVAIGDVPGHGHVPRGVDDAVAGGRRVLGVAYHYGAGTALHAGDHLDEAVGGEGVGVHGVLALLGEVDLHHVVLGDAREVEGHPGGAGLTGVQGGVGEDRRHGTHLPEHAGALETRGLHERPCGGVALVVVHRAVHLDVGDAGAGVRRAEDVAVALSLEHGARRRGRARAEGLHGHPVDHRRQGDHDLLVLADVVQADLAVGGAGGGEAVDRDARDLVDGVVGGVHVGRRLDHRLPGHMVGAADTHRGAPGDAAGAALDPGGHTQVIRPERRGSVGALGVDVHHMVARDGREGHGAPRDGRLVQRDAVHPDGGDAVALGRGPKDQAVPAGLEHLGGARLGTRPVGVDGHSVEARGGRARDDGVPGQGDHHRVVGREGREVQGGRRRVDGPAVQLHGGDVAVGARRPGHPAVGAGGVGGRGRDGGALGGTLEARGHGEGPGVAGRLGVGRHDVGDLDDVVGAVGVGVGDLDGVLAGLGGVDLLDGHAALLDDRHGLDAVGQRRHHATGGCRAVGAEGLPHEALDILGRHRVRGRVGRLHGFGDGDGVAVGDHHGATVGHPQRRGHEGHGVVAARGHERAAIAAPEPVEGERELIGANLRAGVAEGQAAGRAGAEGDAAELVFQGVARCEHVGGPRHGPGVPGAVGGGPGDGGGVEGGSVGVGRLGIGGVGVDECHVAHPGRRARGGVGEPAAGHGERARRHGAPHREVAGVAQAGQAVVGGVGARQARPVEDEVAGAGVGRGELGRVELEPDGGAGDRAVRNGDAAALEVGRAVIDLGPAAGGHLDCLARLRVLGLEAAGAVRVDRGRGVDGLGPDGEGGRAGDVVLDGGPGGVHAVDTRGGHAVGAGMEGLTLGVGLVGTQVAPAAGCGGVAHLVDAGDGGGCDAGLLVVRIHVVRLDVGVAIDVLLDPEGVAHGHVVGLGGDGAARGVDHDVDLHVDVHGGVGTTLAVARLLVARHVAVLDDVGQRVGAVGQVVPAAVARGVAEVDRQLHVLLVAGGLVGLAGGPEHEHLLTGLGVGGRVPALPRGGVAHLEAGLGSRDPVVGAHHAGAVERPAVGPSGGDAGVARAVVLRPVARTPRVGVVGGAADPGVGVHQREDEVLLGLARDRHQVALHAHIGVLLGTAEGGGPAGAVATHLVVVAVERVVVAGCAHRRQAGHDAEALGVGVVRQLDGEVAGEELLPLLGGGAAGLRVVDGAVAVLVAVIADEARRQRLVVVLLVGRVEVDLVGGGDARGELHRDALELGVGGLGGDLEVGEAVGVGQPVDGRGGAGLDEELDVFLVGAGGRHGHDVGESGGAGRDGGDRRHGDEDRQGRRRDQAERPCGQGGAGGRVGAFEGASHGVPLPENLGLRPPVRGVRWALSKFI